jgi:hypothetical protein
MAISGGRRFAGHEWHVSQAMQAQQAGDRFGTMTA